MITAKHINPAFDESLAEMDSVLEQMEDAVIKQIKRAQSAFSEMSVKRARKVGRKDKHLNFLSEEIEAKAVNVLAKHQPVAEDLRHVVGALKMSIEYERIGDYVKNLAESTARLAGHDENLEVFPSLRGMLDEVSVMFDDYVSARRGKDLKEAVRVWLRDQRIDDLCSEVVREAYANQKKGDGGVHSLMHALSVAKNSERIGDKIKNLVEIYYQQKTGKNLAIGI